MTGSLDVVVPFHEHREYADRCIDLLNSEWPQARIIRHRYLEKSCDQSPIALLFLLKIDEISASKLSLVGHACLCSIPGRPADCWVQSVVVDKRLRGRGYGKRLMLATERYAQEKLNTETVYLSTHDKQNFYESIGYELCPPVFNVGSNGKLLNDEKFKKFTQSLADSSSTVIVKEISSSNQIIAPTTISENAPPPPPAPIQERPKSLNQTNAPKMVFMKKILR